MIGQLLRNFRKTDGSIAIEFAILLPVMTTLMFGSFEMTRLARSSMRANNAAQTIADLLAQQTNVTSSVMSNICAGGKVVMIPFPSAGMVATAASVTNYSSGRTVDWQDTTCGSGSTISTATTLGTSYTPTVKDSVIVVRVTYAYTPILTTVLSGTITLTRYAYSRPRTGTTITHS